MAELPLVRAPYVFLSYSSSDRDRALAVAGALDAAGLAVWLDRQALLGGSSWSVEIVRAVKDCTAFLVLGSGQAFTSPNVQRELNLAVEENRPIVPLLLELVTLPDEVRYALAGRQWVELLDKPEGEWLPPLVQALLRLGLNPPASPRPAAPVHASLVQPVARASKTNLPAALSSFIGREREVVEVSRLLEQARLVALTGPGGIGKTRLALAVARQLAASFPDGVYFVDLATVTEPQRVMQVALLAVEGEARAGTESALRGANVRPAIERLVELLQGQHSLLIIDNFEQVLPAAPQLIDLLSRCADLRLLVTSRAALRVRGVRQFAVPPLPLPEIGGPVTATSLAANPAVQLFVERAQDVRPGFELSGENAADLAAICARLDGLPLAIELAAARVRLLSPQALLIRLEHRLRVLSGGARDLPRRQQALRTTIDWSYELLSPGEQQLFGRLAVFTGGCTLEAAEAVCGLEWDGYVLDGIATLSEASLLRTEPGPEGEPRLSMLETIREYGLERLADGGEAEIMRHRHAEYFAALVGRVVDAAETGRAPVFGQEPLLHEQANVLQALAWSKQDGDGSLCLRLAGRLRVFFMILGLPQEGQHWFTTALALPAAVAPSIERARLLYALGMYLAQSSQPREAWPLLGEAAAFFERTASPSDLALIRFGQAFLETNYGEPAAALRLAEAGLRLREEAGHGSSSLALALWQLSVTAVRAGDTTASQRYAEACEALYREVNDGIGLAMALNMLGELARIRGDYVQARAAYEEALTLRGHDPRTWMVGMLLQNLGHVAMHDGESARARELYRDGLRGRLVHNQLLQAAWGVAACGYPDAAEGLAEQAARLFGAGEGALEGMGGHFGEADQPIHSHYVALARAALGEEAYTAAYAQGRTLSLDEAVRLALADPAADLSGIGVP